MGATGVVLGELTCRDIACINAFDMQWGHAGTNARANQRALNLKPNQYCGLLKCQLALQE